MNENTLSANLERIKNAVDDIRWTTQKPTEAIETVTDAVSDLKLKGHITLVKNTYELNEISNPHVNDLAIINTGSEEIEWDNENISSNILIFPETVYLPEHTDNDAGMYVKRVNGDDAANSRIEYNPDEDAHISLIYGGVELYVTYNYISQTDHYELDSISYVLNGDTQTVENNTVVLPFCVSIAEGNSWKAIDFNCVKQFIHTYKMIPYDYFMEYSHSFVIKGEEFTLDQPVTETISGSVTANGDNGAGTWYLTPTEFEIEIYGDRITYTSTDGQYYVYDSSDMSYTLLCHHDWDGMAIWGDESAVLPAGVMGQIFSYIPEYCFSIYKRNNDGWQHKYTDYE